LQRTKEPVLKQVRDPPGFALGAKDCLFLKGMNPLSVTGLMPAATTVFTVIHVTRVFLHYFF